MVSQWKRLLSRDGRECKSTFVALYHRGEPGLGVAAEEDKAKSFPDQSVSASYLINVVKQS